MFISKREATERLESDRNLFRDEHAKSSATVANVDSTTIHPIKPDPAAQAIARIPKDTKTRELDRILDLANATRMTGAAGRSPQVDAAIAESSFLMGAQETARMFNVPLGTAQSLGRKLKDPDSVTNQQLKEELLKTRSRLGLLASSRLEKALNCLTDDKIEKIQKATNLSRIAKDLASIMDKVAPAPVEMTEEHVHFHVFKPEIASESQYDTVVVGPALPVIDVDPVVKGPEELRSPMMAKPVDSAP